MKEIKAIIQPYKLDEVLFALRAIEDLPAATVSECRIAAEHDDHFHEIRKSKVEIVVADALVDRVVNTIARAARTGHAGDGKIFVIPVERSVLIREETGAERREDAPSQATRPTE